MQTTSIVNQIILLPTSLQSSLLSRPFSGSFAPLKRVRDGRERASTSILAVRSDGKRKKRWDSKLVDENMVVLKMRIQEMEMKERENADNPLEKEQEWYKNYDSDVYELVGLLQILMMNNRPSLVLGVVALLVFSSSTSLVAVLSYLFGIVM